jgi:putative hemolysin
MKNINRVSLAVFVLMICLALLISGCAGNSSSQSSQVESVEAMPVDSKTDSLSETATPNQNVKIANPASMHCIKNNGKLEIMDGKGGQYGVCVFEDGSRCEEWSFFRKECSPGTCRETSGICKKENQ